MTLALAIMMLNPTTPEAVLPMPFKPAPEWLTIEATAYTAECKGCTGITNSGYDVRHTIYYKGLRIVAVDPNVIPLHSLVEIDTGNRLIEAIALDIGGAIKGNRLDLLMETKNEAFQFGRRDVKVRVVENNR